MSVAYTDLSPGTAAEEFEKGDDDGLDDSE